MTQDEIYEKVSGTLVEALNVDQDEVDARRRRFRAIWGPSRSISSTSFFGSSANSESRFRAASYSRSRSSRATPNRSRRQADEQRLGRVESQHALRRPDPIRAEPGFRRSSRLIHR